MNDRLAITFAMVAFLLPQIDSPAMTRGLPGRGRSSLALVNGVVKPIIKLFSLPVTLMTLGLFGLVSTPVLLLLCPSPGCPSLVGIAFTVGGFPPN